jgi:hypothetical protein
MRFVRKTRHCRQNTARRFELPHIARNPPWNIESIRLRAHKNTKHHKTENNEIHKDKNTYLAYTKEVRDLLQHIANWDNGLQKSVSKLGNSEEYV